MSLSLNRSKAIHSVMSMLGMGMTAEAAAAQGAPAGKRAAEGCIRKPFTIREAYLNLPTAIRNLMMPATAASSTGNGTI